MEINTLACCRTDAEILWRVAFGPLATWINSPAILRQKKICPYAYFPPSQRLQPYTSGLRKLEQIQMTNWYAQKQKNSYFWNVAVDTRNN